MEFVKAYNELGELEFDFEITQKITVLCGDSSSGKTRFAELIHGSNRGDFRYESSMTFTRETDVKKLGSGKYFIVLDEEDIDGTVCAKLQEDGTLTSQNVYVILIGRDDSIRLPLGADSRFEIIHVDAIGRLKPYTRISCVNLQER